MSGERKLDLKREKRLGEFHDPLDRRTFLKALLGGGAVLSLGSFVVFRLFEGEAQALSVRPTCGLRPIACLSRPISCLPRPTSCHPRPHTCHPAPKPCSPKPICGLDLIKIPGLLRDYEIPKKEKVRMLYEYKAEEVLRQLEIEIPRKKGKP